MNEFLLFRILRSRARARLRNVLRGYRRLKATGNLGRIVSVKQALTITPLVLKQGLFSSLAWPGGDGEVELSVRQFLLARIAGVSFNSALLHSVSGSNRPVVYPLPSQWRQVLRQHGFNVSEFASAALWFALVAIYFVNGIRVLATLTAANCISSLRLGSRLNERYVYFDSLSGDNLPNASSNGDGYDVVSWYLKWDGRARDIDAIRHNVRGEEMLAIDGVRISPVPTPIEPIFRGLTSIKLLFSGLGFSLRCILDVLTGNWWRALMSGEVMKAMQVRHQDKKMLACDYLFHNSNWIYRPLWTYPAERSGARILFYFYSTNCEPFKRDGAYPELTYGWRAMSWPNYLVWDEYQLSFVRRAVGDRAQVIDVGSIWFGASADRLTNVPDNGVAVFDVQPMRDAVYKAMALDFEYYVPLHANKFLKDVSRTVVGQGMSFVLKRKRNIGRRAHPKYLQIIAELAEKPGCVEINSDVAAVELINKCRAVISMPFTSTALLARDLGKPSIYYDPNGVCDSSDRAAHGIEVISGVTALKDWLSSLSENERDTKVAVSNALTGSANPESVDSQGAVSGNRARSRPNLNGQLIQSIRNFSKRLIEGLIGEVVSLLPRSVIGRFAHHRVIEEIMGRHCEVVHKGKKMFFSVPNGISQYRASSFATKEPSTLEWIEGMPVGSIVWDIGANVGLYSIYASVARGCKVYAFEPSVFNLELLARNISLNKLQHLICVVPIALSDRAGSQLFKMSNTEWGGALSTFGQSFNHNGTRLDKVFEYQTIGISMADAIQVLHIPAPRYIKIDVDGIEHIILRGAIDVLASVDSVLLEINDEFHEQATEAARVLEGAGLTLYRKCDPGGVAIYNQWWTREIRLKADS